MTEHHPRVRLPTPEFTVTPDVEQLDMPAPDAAKQPTSGSALLGRARGLLRVTLGSASRHRAILAFLVAIFLGRLFLADWNSYWNDEILSVSVYGIRHDSALAAVRQLAEASIHPPLYQFILYNWMSLFGDGEIATRTLSNIYITLAALFLYATVRLRWSAPLAFSAAAVFSVMNLPTYYALESRSYAQTIFLVTVSSWLLLRTLFKLKSGDPWRAASRNISVIGIVSVNSALMMTHYYNVFWLIAQAVFVTVYLLVEWPRRRWPSGLLLLLVIGGMPQLLFIGVWGRIFLRQYRYQVDSYSVDGSVSQSVLDLLMTTVVSRNLSAPLVLLALIGAAALAVLIAHVVGIVRRRSPESVTTGWLYVYLVTWLVLPLIVVFTVFTAAGVERYNARYFVFSIPPLTALVVVAISTTVGWAIRRFGATDRPNMGALVAGILAFSIAIPGGLGAATDRKADWRGVAGSVIEVVQGDPDNDYVLVEGSFSAGSRLNYYFERLSDDISVDLTARRNAERAGDHSGLLEQLPEPGDGSRIILILNHHRSSDFPLLLELLDERYELLHTKLNARGGEGYLVYSSEE